VRLSHGLDNRGVVVRFPLRSSSPYCTGAMRMGALYPSVKYPGRELLTHLHLVPRLRMSGAILL
jgi:hypothetical protein